SYRRGHFNIHFFYHLLSYTAGSLVNLLLAAFILVMTFFFVTLWTISVKNMSCLFSSSTDCTVFIAFHPKLYMVEIGVKSHSPFILFWVSQYIYRMGWPFRFSLIRAIQLTPVGSRTYQYFLTSISLQISAIQQPRLLGE